MFDCCLLIVVYTEVINQYRIYTSIHQVKEQLVTLQALVVLERKVCMWVKSLLSILELALPLFEIRLQS